MKYKPRKASEEKRRQILIAASDLFGKRGTSNATLEEIAEQVGMTRAGLLHYVGSKQKLLMEVIKFRDNYELEEYEDNKMPSDGEEVIRHLLSSMKANEQRPGIVRTFSVLSGEALVDENPGSDYFSERYESLRRDIINALIDIARTYKLTIDMAQAEQASASIVAVMDGLQIQWLHSPDDVALADSAKFAILAIIAGVFPESSRKIFEKLS